MFKVRIQAAYAVGNSVEHGGELEPKTRRLRPEGLSPARTVSNPGYEAVATSSRA